MRKLRWQPIAALAAVAIGVIVAIRWTGDGRLDPTAMAAYFPKREAALAYIDIAAIRDSGLLEKLLGSSTVGEEPEYKTFLKRTGFDYKRDLDQALLSSASGVHYFLLKGRFDWNKLKNYAAQEGGKCDGEYCFVSGSTPGRVISFYAVKPYLMALASGATEKAAREIVRRNPEKLGFEVPAKPVWLHAPSALLRDQQQLPAGTRLFMKALEVAEQVMMTIGPSADAFEVVMDVTCRTEQEAAVLKAQLEGITTLLGKLITREKQTPNAGDLSGVLTSGAFQRDSRHVLGRWPIPKAFLDSLSGS